jgi:antitoxin PrlF
MGSSLTSKGQVTIPKKVRDALDLAPGSLVEFVVNDQGEVILQKAGHRKTRTQRKDRFEAARGKAQVKWRSDELMALLRD